MTAQLHSNANGSRHRKRHGSERRAAGHGRCRAVKNRLGVKGFGVTLSWATMDRRRGAPGARKLGMRQQAPTNVGKLRRWSGHFLTLTRWSRGGTNFVRLTVRPGLHGECPALLVLSRLTLLPN